MGSTKFHIGQRLTNFSWLDVTVERVEVGGFGEVAMGPNQPTEGQWLALKVLRPDMLVHEDNALQERLRANFMREALTWCGLWPHANLLTALNVTEVNSELVLVLDYASGGSMRTQSLLALKQGIDPSVRLCLMFAQQIAAGLVELHTPRPDLMRDQPIVHRDLKPENILIGNDKLFKIADFGMAKAVQDLEHQSNSGMSTKQPGGLFRKLLGGKLRIQPTQTQLYKTQRGVAMGTPAYMAPEQWIDAALAGCPADVYAFGIILAELLTGQHPLLDLDMNHSVDDWRAAHFHAQPRPLSTLRRAGTMHGRDVATKLQAELAAEWQKKGVVDISPIEEAFVTTEEAMELLDGLVGALLSKQPEERPTMEQALTDLRVIGFEVGIVPYTPPSIVPDTAEFARTWWHESANTYFHVGQYPEALVRIERAMALDPAYPGTYFTKGKVLQVLGRREDSLHAFRYALAQTPTDDGRERGIILGQIGVALKNLGQYAEAEKTFAEAIAYSPSNATEWHNRSVNAGKWAEMEASAGNMATAREHMEDAIRFVQQALTLNPDSPRYLEWHQTLALLQTLLT